MVTSQFIRVVRNLDYELEKRCRKFKKFKTNETCGKNCQKHVLLMNKFEKKFKNRHNISFDYVVIDLSNKSSLLEFNPSEGAFSTGLTICDDRRSPPVGENAEKSRSLYCSKPVRLED